MVCGGIVCHWLVGSHPRLCASAKLSAYDICVLCHLADQAGVEGGHFGLYGRPPDLQSGKYQSHLDQVLPSPSRRIEVQTPMNPNRQPVRSVRSVPVRMASEALMDEIETDPTTTSVMTCSPDAREHCILDTDAYRKWVQKHLTSWTSDFPRGFGCGDVSRIGVGGSVSKVTPI